MAESLEHAYDFLHPANGPKEQRLTLLMVAWQIQARLLGFKVILSGREIPDWKCLWARHAHLNSVANYLEHRVQHVRETWGTEANRLYTMETVGQACPTACMDLVTVLGFGELCQEEGLQLPETLDPKWWEKWVKTARVSAKVELSSLWLPYGKRTGTLHIEEKIELYQLG